MQIDATFEAKNYTDMIIGFDMVNEEDFTPEVDFFMPQIYEAKAKAKNEAQRLLLQALVELAKEAEKKEPTKVYHSSNPLKTGM